MSPPSGLLGTQMNIELKQCLKHREENLGLGPVSLRFSFCPPWQLYIPMHQSSIEADTAARRKDECTQQYTSLT